MFAKTCVGVLTVAVLLTVGACAPARKSVSPAGDVQSMQRRLSEINEKVDQLSQRVTLLQLLVDNHQQLLQEQVETPAVETSPEVGLVDDTQDATPPATDTPTASSPDGPAPSDRILVKAPNPAYQAAMETFRSGDYATAGKRFDAFVSRFPDDELADNALYWSGESHYARKEYQAAVTRFKKVVENYPQGSKVPDALLKIGYSHISMGDNAAATPYLRQVLTQYPFSPAATMAEKKLQTLPGN